MDSAIHLSYNRPLNYLTKIIVYTNDECNNIQYDLSQNRGTAYQHIAKYLTKHLRYNAPTQDLKVLYASVICSTLEFGAQALETNIDQSLDLEIIQKQALRIIFPELTHDEAFS